jgi:ABC-2 type transport system ATP-binding protein
VPNGAPAIPGDLAPDGAPNVLAARPLEGVVELRTDAPTELLHRLTGWALASGFAFEEITVTRPSLEDAYLALTAEEAPG